MEDKDASQEALEQVEKATKLLLCVGMIGVAFFAMSSPTLAQDLGDKGRKHHKLQEWLSLLSGEDRAKLHSVREQALKDPAVQEAYQRHKKAEAEYRELLHKEMLKTDPSLKPMLDKIDDLKKQGDY